MTRFAFSALLPGMLLLAGCAAPPAGRYATADTVLAAQYDAGGAHGAMRGAEADAILDAYARRIAAPPMDMRTDADSAGPGLHP